MLALGRLSWLVACVALAALGLVERLGSQPPPGLLLGALLVIVVLGALAALWVRRRGDEAARRQALLGLGANGAVALVLGLATLAGVRARDRDEDQVRRIRASVMEAVAGTGWTGGVQVGAARLFAAQISHGELKDVLARTFRQPFALVLMGVDNTKGTSDVVLDLSLVHVLYADGRQHPGLGRAMVMASTPRTDEEVRKHAGGYRVPAGTRFDNALAFLPADTDFDKVVGLEVRVNGQPVMLRGRWLTAEEKAKGPPR